MTDETGLRSAAEAIASADALVIAAGAGMGVDSGLPDFRGSEGFWMAYPPYARLGLSFSELANPRWFHVDAALAWGFYGHRLNLYRATRPHEGYHLLHRWSGRMRHGSFVYTSNVDGAFHAAGFDPPRILEVHGSIHWMQCLRRCGIGLFPSDKVVPNELTIDEQTFRAAQPLPACPTCRALARPNVLMFGDGDWDESRSFEQETQLRQWLAGLTGTRMVIIECGAGNAVPTVRDFCEGVAERFDATLVRINLRDPDVPRGQIGLAMGALAAIRAIDSLLSI